MSEEYNTSPYDDDSVVEDSTVDEPMSKSEYKDAKNDLRHKREIYRLIEKNKMYDDNEDRKRAEIMAEKDPGGEKDLLKKYGPEGPHDSHIMNFLTSSDPLEGITDLYEDRVNYAMLDMKNHFRHRTTRHKITKQFKYKGYNKYDRKIAAEILANQAEYGNEALDSARLERHLSGVGSGRNRSNEGPDM